MLSNVDDLSRFTLCAATVCGNTFSSIIILYNKDRAFSKIYVDLLLQRTKERETL
jgi:hypothetical protein